jgi:hypothetical protein
MARSGRIQRWHGQAWQCGRGEEEPDMLVTGTEKRRFGGMHRPEGKMLFGEGSKTLWAD